MNSCFSCVDVNLQDYPQVINYRAGKLLSLLKTKYDSTLPPIELQNIRVATNHISVTLSVPLLHIHCIVLLDLVPTHADFPTSREIKRFIWGLRSGTRPKLPHTFILYVPSHVATLQFIDVGMIEEEGEEEEEEREVGLPISLLLVTQCGELTTATFSPELFQWTVIKDSIALIRCTPSENKQRWMESVEFHLPTRTLLWVMGGSVMSALIPSQFLLPSRNHSPGGHSSPSTLDSSSGVSDSFCQINCVPLCTLSMEKYEELTGRIHLAVDSHGCWLLVPTASIVSNINSTSLAAPSQGRNSCDSSCDDDHLGYSVQFLDFSTGRHSVWIKLAHDSAVFSCSLLLSNKGERAVHGSVKSSVFVIDLPCPSTLEEKGVVIAVSSIDYVGGGVLVAHEPVSLPPLPVPHTGEECSTVQKMLVTGGLLMLMLKGTVLFTSVSRSTDPQSQWQWWAAAAANRRERIYAGVWSVETGACLAKCSRYCGPLPSSIGVFTSGGSMVNVLVRWKALATGAQRLPSGSFSKSHKMSSAASSEPELEDDKWMSGLLNFPSDLDSLLVPPLLTLQRNRNWINRQEHRVVQSSADRTPSPCFVKMLLGAFAVAGTIQIRDHNCSDSDLLCHLLSDNVQHTNHPHNVSPSMMSCQQKLAEFFTPHHSDRVEHSLLRSFDLCDFVKDVKSWCVATVAPKECYVEDAVRYFLHILREQEEWSSAASDFVFVTTHVALSLQMQQEHEPERAQQRARQPHPLPAKCSPARPSAFSSCTREETLSGPFFAVSVVHRLLLVVLQCTLATASSPILATSEALVSLSHSPPKNSPLPSNFDFEQMCNPLFDLLKERLGQGESCTQRGLGVRTTAIQQDLMLQLLCLSGHALRVMELLHCFRRFGDLLLFGQGVLEMCDRDDERENNEISADEGCEEEEEEEGEGENTWVTTAGDSDSDSDNERNGGDGNKDCDPAGLWRESLVFSDAESVSKFALPLPDVRSTSTLLDGQFISLWRLTLSAAIHLANFEAARAVIRGASGRKRNRIAQQQRQELITGVCLEVKKSQREGGSSGDIDQFMREDFLLLREKM